MDPIETAVSRAITYELERQKGLMLQGWQHVLQPEVIARAVIAALDAAGFVVVPAEPTEAVLVAAGFGKPGREPYLDAESDYRAMIDAAKKKGLLDRPASSLSVDELHSRTPATWTQKDPPG